MTERALPRDIETEESILASCVNSPEDAIEIVDMLNKSAFYKTSNAKIFEAISELVGAGIRVDVRSLGEQLKRKQQFKECGGVEYLKKLLFEIPVSVNTDQDCIRIKEKKALRDIITVSQKTIGMAYDLEKTSSELIDDIQKNINNIALFDIDNDCNLQKTLHEVCDNINRRIDNKKEITGVDTGFSGLNWYTSGFQNSDLILIAARPSVGKTSLALNFLINAVKQGIWVDFYSYEMSNEQLVTRLISMVGRVGYKNLQSGYMTRDDIDRYNSAAAAIHGYKACLIDNGDMRVNELRRTARRNKNKHNTGLIIVDYLQLIPKEKQNTNDAVSEISRSLKMMAKELDVPVIALSQLNRRVEERENKLPTLADLRDSGSLEQDADLVIFPYRPGIYIKKKYHEDGKTETTEYRAVKNDAMLYVEKQRNGPVGCTKISWDGEFSTFYQGG